MFLKRKRLKYPSNIDKSRFCLSDISESLKNAHISKSPGIDKLHNFYYKHLERTHRLIPNILSNLSNHFSDWRSTLPITSCITEKFYQHCKDSKYVAEEQKGSSRNMPRTWKTEHILLIWNKLSESKEICTLPIDYSDAYYSVPDIWFCVAYLQNVFKNEWIITNSDEWLENPTRPVA